MRNKVQQSVTAQLRFSQTIYVMQHHLQHMQRDKGKERGQEAAVVKLHCGYCQQKQPSGHHMG
jgi:hypothetical protein